jgi:hypothetical protein
MDYAKSAVNLQSSPIIKEKLEQLKAIQEQIGEYRRQMEELIPADLKAAGLSETEKFFNLQSQIKALIETEGSYQDLENNLYAIKQKKVTKSYDTTSQFAVSRFKDCFPKFANAVIVRSLDTQTLSGLVRGELINEDDLQKVGILIETPSYTYIVKVD